MTENKWPEDGSYSTPMATQRLLPLRPETTFPASGERWDRKDRHPHRRRVRQDRCGPGRSSRPQAPGHRFRPDSGGDGQNRSRQRRHRGKNQRPRPHQQAKADLTDQAGTQQQKAAEGIRAVSSQLRTMAEASAQPGVATDLVRQAAERSQSVATWLENRDPGSLMKEVKSFARQRPGTFLMIAAGAGLLAGRLGRSLQAGAPDTAQQSPSKPAVTWVPGSGTAVPPPPGDGYRRRERATRFFDETTALPGTASPVSTGRQYRPATAQPIPPRGSEVSFRGTGEVAAMSPSYEYPPPRRTRRLKRRPWAICWARLRGTCPP